MDKWLLKRLFENKKGEQPIPRFAFQSTVNWMQALAIICDSSFMNDLEIKKHYLRVQRRSVNEDADTWVFENILMALHNVSALDEMQLVDLNKVAIVRSAIIAWYYAIYYSSSAMIASASGSKQETHAATAKVWQKDIAEKGLAIGPFNLSIDTLVKKDVKQIVSKLRNGNEFVLVNSPMNEEEAWGAIYGYLSGTASYEKWRVEERVKTSKEFRLLDVKNFMKKEARELRDLKLQTGYVNFLVQAFRYRGKANYRDSIYLSYGENRAIEIEKFVNNLYSVSRAYTRMACTYASKRVEKNAWSFFTQDLNDNLKINIDSNIYEI